MCFNVCQYIFSTSCVQMLFHPFWRGPIIKGCGGFGRVSCVHCVSSVHHIYFAPNSGALQHVQEVEWGRLGHPRSPLSAPRILKGGKGRAPVLLWVCACLRQQRIIQRAVADKIQRSASSSSGSGAAQRDGEPVADHCRSASLDF